MKSNWKGPGIFLFAIASRPALGPTQPPIQWVPEALYLGKKRPGPEADHSNLVPRLRMRGAIPLPPYAFMAWDLGTATSLPFYLYFYRFNSVSPFTLVPPSGLLPSGLPPWVWGFELVASGSR